LNFTLATIVGPCNRVLSSPGTEAMTLSSFRYNQLLPVRKANEVRGRNQNQKVQCSVPSNERSEERKLIPNERSHCKVH